jgi:hypothetical protein
MRKILFKRVQSIFDISQKMSKSKLKKDNMHSLGKLSTASNLEVSQIECHPELPQVVASTSGNNVLVWDLQSPEQQKTTLNGFKQITSISWRQAQD